MRSHKLKPQLCRAKGDVLRAYLKQGLQLWQVLAGIKTGLIKFESEAKALAKQRSGKAS
jgi:hypothetical protein